MEEIAALITAIIDAFSKRSANKGSQAVGQLRQALAERAASPGRINAMASNRPMSRVPALSAARESPGGVGVPGAPRPPGQAGSFGALGPAGAPPVQATQASAGAPPSAAAQRPDASQGPAAGSVTGFANREARLVVGLFATPQSLAAAFIAAEILAQPVALREH